MSTGLLLIQQHFNFSCKRKLFFVMILNDVLQDLGGQSWVPTTPYPPLAHRTVITSMCTHILHSKMVIPKGVRGWALLSWCSVTEQTQSHCSWHVNGNWEKIMTSVLSGGEEGVWVWKLYWSWESCARPAACARQRPEERKEHTCGKAGDGECPGWLQRGPHAQGRKGKVWTENWTPKLKLGDEQALKPCSHNCNFFKISTQLHLNKSFSKSSLRSRRMYREIHQRLSLGSDEKGNEFSQRWALFTHKMLWKKGE